MRHINTQKEKWNKQKSMGKTKFVIFYGILLWGFSGSLVYGTLTIFFSANPVNYNIAGIVARFVAYAIIFGVAGVIVTIRQWDTKVRKFDSI